MNQLSIDLASARRDLGIERSAEKSGVEWGTLALGFLLEWCARRGKMPFLCEDVREWSEQNGLPAAAQPKAWGRIMRLGARHGIIAKRGYAPAKSSNLSPKVLWSAV